MTPPDAPPTTEGLEDLPALGLLEIVYDDTADTARRIRAAMEIGEQRWAYERDAILARLAALEQSAAEARP